MVTKKISECQSVKFSVILKHPSIRRLLQQQFFKAWLEAFSPTDTTQVQAKTIPLYRLKHDRKIVYRCSLALRLASRLELSAVAIAQQLVTYLTSFNPTLEQPSLEFTLELGEKGIIDCILSDRSLYVWLEQFPEMFLSSCRSEVTYYCLEETTGNNLFPIQYTHARCCALLRLGVFDGLIEFDTQQLDQPRWSWNAPNAIVWEILPKSYEFQLIAQILALVDDIEEVAPKNYVILAIQLCDAFWQLERYCRIWGEIKQKNRKLAEARLGLVAVTQLVLRWLLEEKFKVEVFVEM